MAIPLPVWSKQLAQSSDYQIWFLREAINLYLNAVAWVIEYERASRGKVEPQPFLLQGNSLRVFGIVRWQDLERWKNWSDSVNTVTVLRPEIGPLNQGSVRRQETTHHVVKPKWRNDLTLTADMDVSGEDEVGVIEFRYSPEFIPLQAAHLEAWSSFRLAEVALAEQGANFTTPPVWENCDSVGDVQNRIAAADGNCGKLLAQVEGVRDLWLGELDNAQWTQPVKEKDSAEETAFGVLESSSGAISVKIHSRSHATKPRGPTKQTVAMLTVADEVSAEEPSLNQAQLADKAARRFNQHQSNAIKVGNLQKTTKTAMETALSRYRSQKH